MYAGSKPWIALIDYDKYEACGQTPMHYRYPMYGVLSAQLLGASGTLMVRSPEHVNVIFGIKCYRNGPKFQ